MAEDKDYLEQEEENKEDYENVCFICRRPESKAGKMIDIPGGIHVCMDCMQKSFNSMNNMPMDYSELMKNMPNISMVDLNSLQNEIPKKQRIKKKKAQPEKEANEKIAKKVFAPLTQEMRTGFAAGVTLADGTALSPAEVTALSPDGCTVRVVLRQGVYHQIKRMFGVYGAGVNALHREAIGGLALDAQLAPGQWRELSDEEVAKITR